MFMEYRKLLKILFQNWYVTQLLIKPIAAKMC